ncbi:MAG: hypothetical protein HQ582_07150, partial [Planctomycetes bacterium]|nr:hypothetical protein [Planctomycetota bacterium]
MWFDALFGRRLKPQVHGRRRRAGVERGAPRSRRMRLEPLEERRLLALGDLLYTLSDPGTGAQANSEFGSSVATDGNLAVVGTPLADITYEDVGAVYVYDASTGDLLRTLNNPTPESEDYFGCSVAVSGSTVVVGAWGDDDGASYGGSVYLYDATTGNLLRELNHSSTQMFGYSVAISGDTVVVGAYWDATGATGAGSAYLYDATTGNLLRTLNNPTPANYDRFGISVAISGNTVVVGADQDDTGATDAGSAYIYDAATGNLLHTLNNPAPASRDYFGYSVAVSGNMVVMGATGNDTGGAEDAGSTYLYDAMTGNLLQTLDNPAPGWLDYFGNSVAISGNTLVVGAHADNPGTANDTGSAYIYDATAGNLLQTLNNPTPASYHSFGWSVAVSGNTMVVGAPGDDTGARGAGSAYIYDAATGNLLQTLHNPTPASSDGFGYSAVSGDMVVVGAPWDDTGATDAGSAYIYDATTGHELRTLSNPTPASSDQFGRSVAVSGNTVVV